MILYVLDENLEVRGVIDTWISLMWTTKLQTAGTFELYLSNTPRNRAFLQPNRFLARSDIAKMMYITTIEEKRDDSGKTLTVSGYSAEGIFRKRMYPIWATNFKHGDMYTIPDIFRNMTPLGPKIITTTIDKLYTGEVSTSDMKTDMETYLRFLLAREGDEDNEASHFWQTPSTYSLEFDYNYPNQGFLFVQEYLKDENSLPFGVVSEDIGNLKDSTYSYSEEGCTSSIIALIDTTSSVYYQEDSGEVDEYGNKLYYQVTLNWDDLENTANLEYRKIAEGVTSNMDINESIIYVSPVVKKDVKSGGSTQHVTVKAVPRDQIYSGTKYASEGVTEHYWSTDASIEVVYCLDQAATMTAMKEAVEKQLKIATENYQGSVDTKKFNAYFIGEIIIIRDNERLKDFYKRVEEIEEVFDSSGYSITPTFGEPLKTLSDYIKIR